MRNWASRISVRSMRPSMARCSRRSRPAPSRSGAHHRPCQGCGRQGPGTRGRWREPSGLWTWQSPGRLPALLAIALALLVGGSVASWLLGRYLRRVTRGWGPEQLGQLFAYYESVLHSVREGVILIDPKGKVVMYNDQAAELLGLKKQASDAAAGTQGPGAPDGRRPEAPSLAEFAHPHPALRNSSNPGVPRTTRST